MAESTWTTCANEVRITFSLPVHRMVSIIVKHFHCAVGGFRSSLALAFMTSQFNFHILLLFASAAVVVVGVAVATAAAVVGFLFFNIFFRRFCVVSLFLVYLSINVSFMFCFVLFSCFFFLISCAKSCLVTTPCLPFEWSQKARSQTTLGPMQK